MRGGDDFGHNLVLNIVTINLSALCTLMKSRIASNEDSSLIIKMQALAKEMRC